MDLPKTISLLHRKMNGELNERLAEIGLSNAQSRLLKILYHNGEMTQADLCNELELDKSTVAKKIARMKNNGLVTKTVNPDDTRSYLVSPTEKGVEIIPKTQKILSDWTEDVTSWMNDEEKDFFYRMLSKVTRQSVEISDK